jgi:predicted Rossmann-fold nucleotide-binding protein
MHIAVFCGSSLPRNKEIVEAAAALGRRIAQEGHTLVYGGSNLGLTSAVDFHSKSALRSRAR